MDAGSGFFYKGTTGRISDGVRIGQPSQNATAQNSIRNPSARNSLNARNQLRRNSISGRNSINNMRNPSVRNSAGATSSGTSSNGSSLVSGAAGAAAGVAAGAVYGVTSIVNAASTLPTVVSTLDDLPGVVENIAEVHTRNHGLRVIEAQSDGTGVLMRTVNQLRASLNSLNQYNGGGETSVPPNEATMFDPLSTSYDPSITFSLGTSNDSLRPIHQGNVTVSSWLGRDNMPFNALQTAEQRADSMWTTIGARMTDRHAAALRSDFQIGHNTQADPTQHPSQIQVAGERVFQGPNQGGLQAMIQQNDVLSTERAAHALDLEDIDAEAGDGEGGDAANIHNLLSGFRHNDRMGDNPIVDYDQDITREYLRQLPTGPAYDTWRAKLQATLDDRGPPPGGPSGGGDSGLAGGTGAAAGAAGSSTAGGQQHGHESFSIPGDSGGADNSTAQHIGTATTATTGVAAHDYDSILPAGHDDVSLFQRWYDNLIPANLMHHYNQQVGAQELLREAGGSSSSEQYIPQNSPTYNPETGIWLSPDGRIHHYIDARNPVYNAMDLGMRHNDLPVPDVPLGGEGFPFPGPPPGAPPFIPIDHEGPPFFGPFNDNGGGGPAPFGGSGAEKAAFGGHGPHPFTGHDHGSGALAFLPLGALGGGYSGAFGPILLSVLPGIAKGAAIGLFVSLVLESTSFLLGHGDWATYRKALTARTRYSICRGILVGSLYQLLMPLNHQVLAVSCLLAGAEAVSGYSSSASDPKGHALFRCANALVASVAAVSGAQAVTHLLSSGLLGTVLPTISTAVAVPAPAIALVAALGSALCGILAGRLFGEIGSIWLEERRKEREFQEALKTIFDIEEDEEESAATPAENLKGSLKDYDLAFLRKAYYAKSRICHPDKGGDKLEFSRLLDAYDLLKTRKIEEMQRSRFQIHRPYAPYEHTTLYHIFHFCADYIGWNTRCKLYTGGINEDLDTEIVSGRNPKMSLLSLESGEQPKWELEDGGGIDNNYNQRLHDGNHHGNHHGHANSPKTGHGNSPKKRALYHDYMFNCRNEEEEVSSSSDSALEASNRPSAIFSRLVKYLIDTEKFLPEDEIPNSFPRSNSFPNSDKSGSAFFGGSGSASDVVIPMRNGEITPTPSGDVANASGGDLKAKLQHFWLEHDGDCETHAEDTILMDNISEIESVVSGDSRDGQGDRRNSSDAARRRSKSPPRRRRRRSKTESPIKESDLSSAHYLQDSAQNSRFNSEIGSSVPTRMNSPGSQIVHGDVEPSNNADANHKPLQIRVETLFSKLKREREVKERAESQSIRDELNQEQNLSLGMTPRHACEKEERVSRGDGATEETESAIPFSGSGINKPSNTHAGWVHHGLVKDQSTTDVDQSSSDAQNSDSPRVYGRGSCSSQKPLKNEAIWVSANPSSGGSSSSPPLSASRFLVASAISSSKAPGGVSGSPVPATTSPSRPVTPATTSGISGSPSSCGGHQSAHEERDSPEEMKPNIAPRILHQAIHEHSTPLRRDGENISANTPTSNYDAPEHQSLSQPGRRNGGLEYQSSAPTMNSLIDSVSPKSGCKNTGNIRYRNSHNEFLGCRYTHQNSHTDESILARFILQSRRTSYRSGVQTGPYSERPSVFERSVVSSSGRRSIFETPAPPGPRFFDSASISAPGAMTMLDSDLQPRDLFSRSNSCNAGMQWDYESQYAEYSENQLQNHSRYTVCIEGDDYAESEVYEF